MLVLCAYPHYIGEEQGELAVSKHGIYQDSSFLPAG